MSKKGNMDFMDFAYREAVNRLKYLLADSYTSPKLALDYHKHNESVDKMDNYSTKGVERPALAEISKYLSPRRENILKKVNPYVAPSTQPKENYVIPNFSNASDFGPIPTEPSVQPPAEILSFIEKQEDYIEQLEKESNYCRNELSNLLNKVRGVISENETLTEYARSDFANFGGGKLSTSSESDDNHHEKKVKKREKQSFLSGPNIVFESRISELEAELAQSHIDCKKIQIENDELKRKIGFGGDSENTEHFRKQVENLQRDKKNLEDLVRKLENNLERFKIEDNQSNSKSQRNRDIAEMALFEKTQAEIEMKRLKEELDRQHERIRELQHEMARRIAEERCTAERRYNYQVDQLGGDLSTQWEQSSKLQLDLERQKRLESDLKRELAQKNTQIEEIKMELKTKKSGYLSDLAQVNAEKQSLETEITALRLQLERAERQNKIEAARLTAEINSLRQRLDRADADILHARRENLRLSDEIAGLEKELALGELKTEVRPGRGDINKTISEMQDKHAGTVRELEEMVQSQKHLMDKLTGECKTLTNKLEETSLKHKMEITALQSNLEFLTNRIINNDRITKNDIYSNLTTNKAPLEYGLPKNTDSKHSTEIRGTDFQPIPKAVPHELTLESARLDDGEYIDASDPREYADDENEKDHFSEGNKPGRSGGTSGSDNILSQQQPEQQQLLTKTQAPYDEKQYETGPIDDQQFTEQNPGYEFSEGYDPQYEGGEYEGDYDQYEGEYEQDYNQSYQPDSSFYGQPETSVEPSVPTEATLPTVPLPAQVPKLQPPLEQPRPTIPLPTESTVKPGTSGSSSSLPAVNPTNPGGRLRGLPQSEPLKGLSNLSKT